MLAHIHPSRLSFTCETRPIFHDTAYPGSESGAGQGPPGAQSPFAPSGMMLPSPMETLPPIIAHTGSCARPKPSRRLRLSLIRRDGFRGHSCKACTKSRPPDSPSHLSSVFAPFPYPTRFSLTSKPISFLSCRRPTQLRGRMTPYRRRTSNSSRRLTF